MDGKEYVTEKKLEREIRDQIYLKGGRITRTDLQAILKIDYSHIERITNNMIQHDAQLTLVNGEIITTYVFEQILTLVNILILFAWK